MFLQAVTFVKRTAGTLKGTERRQLVHATPRGQHMRMLDSSRGVMNKI